MRPSPTVLLLGTAALMTLTLAGCDTVMTGLVGPSKAESEAQRAAAIPAPPPPPSAAFVSDSALAPGHVIAGTVLPPTLDTSTAPEPDEPLPQSSAGPHKVLATVPLSSDSTALASLASAANRDAKGANAYFMLLVLSPGASDAAALDKTNTTARDAASRAVTAMGAAGIPADHVEIAMATNPNIGAGEIRLYRR